jgi:hypothetical protein
MRKHSPGLNHPNHSPFAKRDIQMTNPKYSTPMPVDPTRRRFLSQAAGVAVGATAAVVATKAVAASDDSALVKLEEQIFEQYEGATAYDAEIIRLSEIWTTESHRLYEEALSLEKQTGKYLSAQERWALVTDMEESREHSRLCKLQDPFYAKMDALVMQMFATPHTTAEGRRAKATVLLGVIMGDDWKRVDVETDYPELMARKLLIEFIGGEPAEQLRDQFSDGPKGWQQGGQG